MPTQDETYGLVKSHPDCTAVELTDLTTFPTSWERTQYKASLRKKLYILEKWDRIERVPHSEPTQWRVKN